MKDDYTTNSRYLTYTFLSRKVGRVYFLNLGMKGCGLARRCAWFLSRLVCRCARAAQSQGFTHFGLQNYGACYSAAHASQTYADYGSSNACTNNYYSPCDDNSDHQCAGTTADQNYVYVITDGKRHRHCACVAWRSWRNSTAYVQNVHSPNLLKTNVYVREWELVV